MGQQQLILLVLATVIVGIAIVVGIRAFTENDAKANADAMIQDAVRMASDIQAAIKKPDPFGGVSGFSAVTDLGIVGYPVDDQGGYNNINGRYTLAQDAPGLVITGTGPDSTQALQVIKVAVCGLTDTHISGAILTINGEDTSAEEPEC